MIHEQSAVGRALRVSRAGWTPTDMCEYPIVLEVRIDMGDHIQIKYTNIKNIACTRQDMTYLCEYRGSYKYNYTRIPPVIIFIVPNFKTL